jgi:hypothetical protein
MRRLSLTATTDRMINVPRPVDATSVWGIARTLVQQRGTDDPAVAATGSRATCRGRDREAPDMDASDGRFKGASLQ